MLCLEGAHQLLRFDSFVHVPDAKINTHTVPSQLQGVHFAMEFLTKNQKRLLMTGDGKLESNWDGGFISAEGKDVIVIGVSLALLRTRYCCPALITLNLSL